MKFYPYLPHLLSDLDEIRISARSAVDVWPVLWKSAPGRPYFSHRRKLYPTVTLVPSNRMAFWK